jgi:hypothetical protein
MCKSIRVIGYIVFWGWIGFMAMNATIHMSKVINQRVEAATSVLDF